MSAAAVASPAPATIVRAGHVIIHRAEVSWWIRDLADTIFSMGVVSFSSRRSSRSGRRWASGCAVRQCLRRHDSDQLRHLAPARRQGRPRGGVGMIYDRVTRFLSFHTVNLRLARERYSIDGTRVSLSVEVSNLLTRYDKLSYERHSVHGDGGTDGLLWPPGGAYAAWQMQVGLRVDW